jgi:exosortase
LEHLLACLAEQGINKVVVCSNGDGSLLAESIQVDARTELEFMDEPLPAGTAGCIRDAARGQTDSLLLVLPAGILSPPKINTLIQAHNKGKSDLTVVLNPAGRNSDSNSEFTGIYICWPAVLKYIPEEGYYDIKESLIPKMLRDGKSVNVERLARNIGNFRNREEYLNAIADYLQNGDKKSLGLPVFKHNGSQTLWMAYNCEIDPSARIYGPVAVLNGAAILENSVIFGPTIIGRSAKIGKNSLIANSILWDSAEVGSNCEIQSCVLDYHAVIKSNTIIEEKAIPFKPSGILERSISRTADVVKDNANRLHSALQPQIDKVNNKLPAWLKSPGINILASIVGSFILIAFLWSYWPTVADLWNIWQRSDEYSSGLLVPFLAIYILWSRRSDIAHRRLKPSMWGLIAFVAAQAFRLFGLFFMYSSAERLSIIISIAALVLLLSGWQLLRKVFTTLVFLGLMLPLPRSIHNAVMLPLQSWATSSAVFCLEILGYQVAQEGNIIHLNDTTVAVAEACNGLRMIMAFFVISGLVALLVRRAWWEKLIVLVSSIPIGLFCNSIRLTITAIAFTMLQGEHWEKIFHDFGGYAMMPLALGMVVLELWLLTKITTTPAEKQVVLVSK